MTALHTGIYLDGVVALVHRLVYRHDDGTESLLAHTIDTESHLAAHLHQMDVFLVHCELDKRLSLVHDVTDTASCLYVFAQIGLQPGDMPADRSLDGQIGLDTALAHRLWRHPQGMQTGGGSLGPALHGQILRFALLHCVLRCGHMCAQRLLSAILGFEILQLGGSLEICLLQLYKGRVVERGHHLTARHGTPRHGPQTVYAAAHSGRHRGHAVGGHHQETVKCGTVGHIGGTGHGIHGGSVGLFAYGG